jgi:4'-phosphopantetheinyl transferase
LRILPDEPPVLTIYYTYDGEVPATVADRWLAELPYGRQDALRRLQQPHKRRLSLLGTRLLKIALRDLGHADFRLDQLEYPDKRKPSTRLPLDFSISHSGSLVACAIAPGLRVGLDLEQRRAIEPQSFGRLMTQAERERIGDDTEQFFDWWTRKEAVVKAWGNGAVWDMPRVVLDGSIGTIEGTRWHLQPLALDANYAACIATDGAAPSPVMRLVEQELLEER